MENTIRENWQQIIFVAATIFGFGKGWQLISIMCRTLKEHSVELKFLREQSGTYCNHAECEKYRDSCAARNDRRFDEIKVMLQSMDNKRESSRDDTQALLADVSCRLGRIEGKLEREK